MKIIIKRNPEYILPLLLCFINIKNILFVIPQVVQYQSIINICVGISFVIAIILNYKKLLNYKLLCISFIYFVIIVFNAIAFKNNNEYLFNILPNMLTLGYGTFLLAFAIQDYELILKNYIKISRLIFIASTYVFIYLISNPLYSMPYSYGTVFASIFLILSYATDKNKLDGICAILSILYIIAFGSRGTLLCIIAIIFIMHIYINLSSLNYKKLTRIIVLYALIFILFIYFNQVINLLIEFLDSFGIESRTVESLLNNTLADDSGRSEIYGICIKLISENWLIGLGIEGLQGAGYIGLTPHNTYLELLLSFGIIFGMLAILVYCINIFKNIFIQKRGYKKLYFWVFFSLYVPVSFIGAGIWDNYNLAQLMSVGLNNNKRRNEN